MRKKIVAGNWKMNKNYQDALDLAKEITAAPSADGVEIILCPPFTHLKSVTDITVSNKRIRTGAQNCHHESKGAFTGEVSAEMIKSVGATYIIIGHSERREYFKETNIMLASKLDLALANDLLPVFCCGEPLKIREKGTHVNYVSKQLKESLFHLTAEQITQVVIAYEPIWAIGTGLTASPEQAQDMHAAIRRVISRKFGKRIAGKIPILYGGSCNPGNAATLFALPDVDGGLIGGASLKAGDFMAIVHSF